MSILTWFNKPKWQSNIEQVRLTAVQNSHHSELKSHLSDIIFNDASSKVQKAAVNKVNELSLLHHIAVKHPATEIKHLADKKLAQNLALLEPGQVTDEHKTYSKQLQTVDAKTLLLTTGQSMSLRQSALSGISQQGLLGDLLLRIDDAQLQQDILAKINQISTLKRIKSQLGQHNKTLRSALEAQLTKNQPEKAEVTAQALCKQLEDVVLKNQQADLQKIEKDWDKLNKKTLPDKLITRYKGALNTARMTLDSDYRDTFLEQQTKQRQHQLYSQLKTFIEDTSAHNFKDYQQALAQFQDKECDLLEEQQQNQYQKWLQQLQQQLQSAQQTALVPPECHRILDKLQESLNQTAPTDGKINQFKKQWQQATNQASSTADLIALQQQFDEAISRLSDKIKNTAEQRDKAAQDALDLIEPISQKISEGQLSEAKAQINNLRHLQQTAGYNHPLLKQHKFEIDQLWKQLKELRQWQQWSHDKVRQQIIEELNEVVGSGMHPDAVLQKLQHANQQWADLEDMEKLPGDRYSPRNQKQWQAFRTVSQALFEPAQPFFEKRSEQQSKQLDKVNKHIQSMQEANLEEDKPVDLTHLVKTAVNYLKNLDKLTPKDRGNCAKALRHEMNRINEHLAIGFKKAEKNKRQLIEETQALMDVEDIQEAIESAKLLQKQWPKAGYVNSHIERKLWKKFRRANDQVFNRRQAQQQEQKEQYSAHKKACQECINRFKKAIKNCHNIDELDQLKSQFNSQWQQLGEQGNNPAKDQQHILSFIKERQSQLLEQEIRNQTDSWQSLDDLHTQQETGQQSLEELQKALEKQPQINQSIFADRANKPCRTSEQLAMLITGEYLTGLESPSDYMEQRMAYQVNVLADRMAGEEHATNVQQQALDWLKEWYSLNKSDVAFNQQHKQRITKVKKAVTQLATGSH